MSNEGSGWRHADNLPDFDEMLAFRDLSQDELCELRDALQKIVPRRQFGDGVETYEDFIRPQHAQTPEMFKAAKDLLWVRGLLGEVKNVDDGERSTHVRDAVSLAIENLARIGIVYRGLYDTFAFWSPKRRRYIQIDADLRQELLRKAQRQIGFRFSQDRYWASDDQNVELPVARHPEVAAEQKAKAEAWLQRYPWRGGSDALGSLFALERLEPLAPLWHALRILSYNDVIEQLNSP